MKTWGNKIKDFAKQNYKLAAETAGAVVLGTMLSCSGPKSIAEVSGNGGSDISKVVLSEEKDSVLKNDIPKDTISKTVRMPLSAYGDEETQKKILAEAYKKEFNFVEPGELMYTEDGDSIKYKVTALTDAGAAVRKDEFPKGYEASKKDLKEMAKEGELFSSDSDWSIGIAPELSFNDFNKDVFANIFGSYKGLMVNIKAPVYQIKNDALASSEFTDTTKTRSPRNFTYVNTIRDNNTIANYDLGLGAQVGYAKDLGNWRAALLAGLQKGTLEVNSSMEETSKELRSNVDDSFIEYENASLSSSNNTESFTGYALPLDLMISRNFKNGLGLGIKAGVAIPLSGLKEIQYAPGQNVSAPTNYNVGLSITKDF